MFQAKLGEKSDPSVGQAGNVDRSHSPPASGLPDRQSSTAALAGSNPLASLFGAAGAAGLANNSSVSFLFL